MFTAAVRGAVQLDTVITRSQQLRIRIEGQGQFTLGMTVPDRRAEHPNVQVVLGIDVLAFQAMFFERVIYGQVSSPDDVLSPLSFP